MVPVLFVEGEEFFTALYEAVLHQGKNLLEVFTVEDFHSSDIGLLVPFIVGLHVFAERHEVRVLFEIG